MQKMRSILRGRVLRFMLVPLPWILSLHALYWMESEGIWDPHTAFRGLVSVLILAAGIAMSFTVYSLTFRDSK